MQFKCIYSQNNRNDNQEGDKYMPRKSETPRINLLTTTYTGDKKAFNDFMESMIYDYLNSDKLLNGSRDDVIQRVEIID